MRIPAASTYTPGSYCRSMWVIPVFIAIFALPVGAKLAYRGRTNPGGSSDPACLMLVMPVLGSLVAGVVLFLLGRPYDQFFGASIVSFLIVEATIWLAGDEMIQVAESAVVPPIYRRLLIGAIAVVWPLVAPFVLTLTFAA